MTFGKLKFAAVALMSVCVLGVSSANAGTSWEARHPRQDEVLDRAHHQLRRINEERREGDLTGAQAARLRRADHAVIRKDHREASFNGGYITRGEQLRMNRQENHIRRHIPA